jgi:hypothetical protein
MQATPCENPRNLGLAENQEIKNKQDLLTPGAAKKRFFWRTGELVSLCIKPTQIFVAWYFRAVHFQHNICFTRAWKNDDALFSIFTRI